MDSETETRANRVNILILFFLSLGQSQDSWPEGYTKKWWHCLHLRCIQIVDIQNTMHCICMSTIWMKCHLPVKISMRYMLDEADYDAEKNKGKGCQGCWQQVKVDKSVHCVWSLNSQVLCAFGNVYFYNSLSQVGAKRWMFTVWLFTIKKIAVTAVTKEKQHSKQNTNKSQSYEAWGDKELFKSKKR